MVRSNNIYLSYSWNYRGAYKNLINLLREKPYFTFKEVFLRKDDPVLSGLDSQSLHNLIKKQISSCNVVLILAGVYAAYKPWLDEEVGIAKSELVPPKPVIVITPFGAENISCEVMLFADKVVDWNSKSIIDAIRDVMIS